MLYWLIISKQKIVIHREDQGYLVMCALVIHLNIDRWPFGRSVQVRCPYILIESEWSKLTHKEYKNAHNWRGEGNSPGMCKRLKFHHTNEWYMHKPESENKGKLPWDFEIKNESPTFG